MKKTEAYTGPWPRKRHSHTCITCKRDRAQGAVYCYKSKCALPQSIDSCECCRPLQPSATYRPAAPAVPQLRTVSDFAEWAENLIAREIVDLEYLDLPDGISIDKWGAALLRRGWAWSDEKSRYEKGAWFVWYLAMPGKPVRAILNRMPALPAPIIDDITPAPKPCAFCVRLAHTGHGCVDHDPKHFEAAALDDDGGRTHIGNTPTCESCGESHDHCICEDEPEDFGLVVDVAEVREDLKLEAPAIKRANPAQLSLFETVSVTDQERSSHV